MDGKRKKRQHTSNVYKIIILLSYFFQNLQVKPELRTSEELLISVAKKYAQGKNHENGKAFLESSSRRGRKKQTEAEEETWGQGHSYEQGRGDWQ